LNPTTLLNTYYFYIDYKVYVELLYNRLALWYKSEE